MTRSAPPAAPVPASPASVLPSPPVPGPPPFAPPSPLGPAPDYGVAVSPGPSSRYEVDPSPPPEDNDASAVEADLLPWGWAPVPPGWEVQLEGAAYVLKRPDPSSPGAMVTVQHQQVKWGSSRYCAAPQWHFQACALPPQDRETVHCPSEAHLFTTLDALGLWAGVAPPVVAPAGPAAARRSMSLPWVAGQAMPFIKPLRDWWRQSSAKPIPPPPPRQSPKFKIPVLPAGEDWDAQVARFLLSRAPDALPPPLSPPTAEVLRKAERDRVHALESYSGLSTLLGVEFLVRRLAAVPDLGSLVSPAVLCDYLLPVLQTAAHLLAPAASSDLGRALSS